MSSFEYFFDNFDSPIKPDILTFSVKRNTLHGYVSSVVSKWTVELLENFRITKISHFELFFDILCSIEICIILCARLDWPRSSDTRTWI